MKNPLTQPGIEPATFRFVSQHLNHCATAVPLQRGRGRPKSKWIDRVEEDAMKLGRRNWLSGAQDRGRFRHLLEDPKIHPGL